MLHTNHVHIRDVQKIRRTQIRRQVLFRNLEAHLCRVIVSTREVIDRHDEALHRRKLRRHRATQVGRERGNAAFPRQIIAEKRDLADGRCGLHESLAGGTSRFACADQSYNALRGGFLKNHFQRPGWGAWSCLDDLPGMSSPANFP